MMFKPGFYTSPPPRSPNAPRSKGIYIGAPAAFALELACQHVTDAFCGPGRRGGMYVVGSCLQRPDWRDIDIRMMLDDEAFLKEFPDAGPIEHHRWEFDAKWLLLTTMISEYLSKASGLPVDFQFQAQSHANARHHGRRNAIGLRFSKSSG